MTGPVVVNINDVLEGQVVLKVKCVDRLHLNAYVRNRQVVRFLTEHLGHPIHSSAPFQRSATASGVEDSAARPAIPAWR